MKKVLLNAINILQVLLFGLIYYLGGIISSTMAERKSYDFKTWMNTTQLIARDMRRLIALAFASILLFSLGVIWTLIVSVLTIVVVNIAYYLIKKYSHGREE